jgi:hypothetical protein
MAGHRPAPPGCKASVSGKWGRSVTCHFPAFKRGVSKYKPLQRRDQRERTNVATGQVVVHERGKRRAPTHDGGAPRATFFKPAVLTATFGVECSGRKASKAAVLGVCARRADQIIVQEERKEGREKKRKIEKLKAADGPGPCPSAHRADCAPARLAFSVVTC